MNSCHEIENYRDVYFVEDALNLGKQSDVFNMKHLSIYYRSTRKPFDSNL